MKACCEDGSAWKKQAGARGGGGGSKASGAPYIRHIAKVKENTTGDYDRLVLPRCCCCLFAIRGGGGTLLASKFMLQCFP